MTIQAQIELGLEAIDLAATPQQVALLVQTIEQLQKWNQAFNLTAIRDVNAMVTLHLLDSLAVIPFLNQGITLDIGTGPGFPGIPLAIMQPERPCWLLDSNGKKTRYVRQLSHELQLNNVTVVDRRVEQWQPEQPFSIITSRAFASLRKMVEFSSHLLAPDGVWQAMKGELPSTEIDELPDSVEVTDIQRLQVPGLEAQRHLITIRKKLTE
ncbi:MAG: 16S rRNA (guanine(527)-N(7))-methyltransferase RsmG [Gammaproteobacteria bacterium]|nr:16S rRNA (guanine(527)-N(7))-methyltransferase RsmG [Gammaproteobacteria bacterium]NVK87139.1 16S rRNA (guanine(527)-N(7))-methyltransferase RsmG [Gammaproteobacteria bacterium]